MNSYDVVIHANEVRYWAFMIGSILAGIWVVRTFASLDEKARDVALRQGGCGLDHCQHGDAGIRVFEPQARHVVASEFALASLWSELRLGGTQLFLQE